MCFDVLYYPENDITKNSTERKTANERAEFQPPATGIRAVKPENEHTFHREQTREDEKSTHTNYMKKDRTWNAKKTVEKKRMKYSNNNKCAGIEFCFILFCFVSFHSVLFCSGHYDKRFLISKITWLFCWINHAIHPNSRSRHNRRERVRGRKKTKDWY